MTQAGARPSGSVGYAVAAPQFAKLADRYGRRRVLRPQVLVFTAATAALMAGLRRGRR